MADTDAPQDPAPARPRSSPSTMQAMQDAKRLHPMTLVQRVLVSLPALAFILWPALTGSNAESWFSLMLGLLYGFVALPAIVLQYLRFSYRITSKELIIQSGVFTRKNRSIPIERVQNIQIEQTLLPRLTGTAKVKIETAGSTATEGVLEYVSLAEAHAIRRVIRSFKRQHEQEAATEPEAEDAAASSEETTARALFSMPLHRVLLSGVFRFSLLYIALIFSGLELLNPDPNTLTRWFTRGEGSEVLDTALQSPWLTATLSLLAAGLLAWLTGVAINTNRYYNFRLWQEEDKLRFRRGLLTLAEGTIPLQKVQTLILRTNPLMRFFGWYRLEVQTVGLNVEEQGHRVVVPFARKNEVLPIARHIAPFTLPETFTRVSPLTIRRHFVRHSVVLAMLTATAIFLMRWLGGGSFVAWVDAGWTLFAMPLILGYAVLHYRHHGYAIGRDGFYVRRGVFKQHVWILPIEKHHVFYTTASLFQQRLGLRSLFVDTAGAAPFAYPEVIDVPEEDAADAQRRLYDQFRARYEARIQAARASSAPLASTERPSIPEEELRDL